MFERVEAEGLEAVQRFLEDLREHVEATKAIHREMANVVYGQAQEAFENERSPAGDVWLPLKPETIRRKGGSKKLYEEGTLQGTLYAVATPEYGEVGVSATANGFPYPAVHQYGSKHVPARPFMPLDENGEVLENTAEEIMAAVLEGIDRVTGG